LSAFADAVQDAQKAAYAHSADGCVLMNTKF